jgi:hypothetical protein
MCREITAVYLLQKWEVLSLTPGDIIARLVPAQLNLRGANQVDQTGLMLGVEAGDQE